MAAQRTAILVAGMHRSGTSATTRVINLLGAELAAELIPANVGNERGHWESAAVQALHNRLLAALDADIYSPVNIPPAWFDSADAQQWTAQIQALLAAEYPQASCFVLKDPRLTLFLPLWQAALQAAGIAARFVLPFRQPAAVAASLEAREHRLVSGDRLPPAQGEAVWLRYVLAAEKYTRGQVRAFVSFDDLLEDWRAQFTRIGRQLGLTWPQWEQASAQIDAFLDATAPRRGAQPAANGGIGEGIYAGLLQLVETPDARLPVFDEASQKLAEAEALLAPYVLARQRVFTELRGDAVAAARRQDGERAAMHGRFADEISLRDSRIAEAALHARQLQQHVDALQREQREAQDYVRSLEQERERVATAVSAQADDQAALHSRFATEIELRDARIADAAAHAQRLQETLTRLEGDREAAAAYAQALAQERDRAAEAVAAQADQQAALHRRFAAEIEARDARMAEAVAHALHLQQNLAQLQREGAAAADYAHTLAKSRDEALAHAGALAQQLQALAPSPRPLACDNVPVFFTIASRNYLAYAITLMQSVAEQHPEAPRYLVLADRDEGEALPAGLPFTVLLAETLDVPDFEAFAFRYTIMEFNTAIKPYAFAELRRRHPQAGLVYLDPDILVVAPLEKVQSVLAGGALAVLTPHLLDPVEDDGQPGEREILASGSYNCGFVAIGPQAGADRLIAWWARRLEFGAYSDIAAGLFTDQKWMDLVPGLFDGVRILRDPGYNLAYWNLSQRPVSRQGSQWLAGASPLAFVHFSGVDLERPALFSKHQNRHDQATIGALQPLYAEYLQRLADNGQREYRRRPYAFGRFSDGEVICDPVRAVFRRYFDKGAPEAQAAPFQMDRDLFDRPCEELPARAGAPVTRLMYALWRLRADLQQAFRLDTAEGRRGFVHWFAHSAEPEMGIPQRYFAPARRALAAREIAQPVLVPAEMPATSEASAASPLPALDNRAQPGSRIAALCLDLLNWSCRSRLLLRCYAAIPLSLRQAVRRRLEGRRRAVPAAASQAEPLPGINLVGYAHGEFGVAEILRRHAYTLQAGGIPFLVHNFDTGVASSLGDRSMQPFLAPDCRYDVNLFCINADQMLVAHGQLGAAVFAGRYNIGCWFWELEKFPAQWQGAIGVVDEIWVTSAFVRDAIAACTSKPVHIVPVALGVDLPAPPLRSDFGLEEDVFLCLFSFDFNSFVVRKNPAGVIAAFRRAFAENRRDVRLLIKTTNAGRFPEALRELVQAAGGDERIEVRDGFLDRRQMWALQACCDCYVSLHRSEGLGLGMAECMLLGKPVVATAYSGNLAFMDADNSALVGYQLVPLRPGDYPAWQGQHWAEPDIAQAADWLRRLADDPAYARQLGEQGRASVSRRLSIDSSLAAVKARLAEIRQRRGS